MTNPRNGRHGFAVLAALAVALAAASLVPVSAHAQILYGSIVGSVTDPQKAALPGVTVTATNTGTGLKVETVTDGTGPMCSATCRRAPTTWQPSLEGFKELRQTGLAVTAGNPRRVDCTLELGGVPRRSPSSPRRR